MSYCQRCADLESERNELKKTISSAHDLLGAWGGAAAGLSPAISNLIGELEKAEARHPGWCGELLMRAEKADAQLQEVTSQLASLDERAAAAIARIGSHQAPMRIPVDPTDPDVVLGEYLTISEEANAFLTPPQPQAEAPPMHFAPDQPDGFVELPEAPLPLGHEFKGVGRRDHCIRDGKCGQPEAAHRR